MLIAALALLGFTTVAGSGPPPAILGARLAVAPEGATACVAELRLRLSRLPPALELVAVEHGGRGVELLGAGAGGRAFEPSALAADPPRRAWRLGLGALPTADELWLRYRVEGAVARRGDEASLLVPLVLPRLRTGPPHPDLFRAELPLPAGHAPWESFPSVPLTRPSTGSVALELPTLPGFVRLDSGAGEIPWLAPARLGDAAALASLAALAALGVGAARRLERARRG